MKTTTDAQKIISGFEKHGLKHLSASQINMFSECAGAWVAKYILGRSFRFGVAPQIGKLAERVVEQTLLDMPFDDAVAMAEAQFYKDNVFNTSEKDMARVFDIRAMAALALEELKLFGRPEFKVGLQGTEQRPIEINCNLGDFSIPVIGYLDFIYPDKGLIVDLKTTQRIPSEMSMAHKRQAALYAAAMGNHAVKFLYVSPKKAVWHEVDDNAAVLANIKAIVSRMEKMLRLLSKEEMQEIIPVNASSFYWSSDRALLNELYGI